MVTCFSVGMRLAGGGGGDRAYHAVRGLIRAGYGQWLFASSSTTDEFGASLRTMGLVGRAMRYAVFRANSRRASCWHDALYDRWVAAQLPECALFHGNMMHALCSLKRARRGGAVALLDRGMEHPQTYARLIADECARWGIASTIEPMWVRRSLEEIEAADLLLVGSDAAAGSHVERGYPPERIVTIPYGVDTQRFAPGAPRGAHPFRVLFVGQVCLGKGVGYLLRAWQSLAWPDAELVLVGNVSAETRAAVRGLLDQPGVFVQGYDRHPELAYQSADVFCLPTLSEGSALVTYEAMASGLPIVTTAAAGAVARDGVEARLVPSGDAQALARALQQLRDDADLRLRLGAAARHLVEQFTWERYGEALAAFYRRLLSA